MKRSENTDKAGRRQPPPLREAGSADARGIRDLSLQAFDRSEAGLVADLAVRLLHERTTPRTLSLVATDGDAIIGHVAFSPVQRASTHEHVGHILAPLAVAPARQKSGIGTALVKHGLARIATSGPCMAFVYGDPRYYARFGFEVRIAQGFIPPHPLQYPEGWQAMTLGFAVPAEGGCIACAPALDDPRLW